MCKLRGIPDEADIRHVTIFPTLRVYLVSPPPNHLPLSIRKVILRQHEQVKMAQNPSAEEMSALKSELTELEERFNSRFSMIMDMLTEIRAVHAQMISGRLYPQSDPYIDTFSPGVSLHPVFVQSFPPEFRSAPDPLFIKRTNA
ncbi:uncharacterized protein SPPG_09136 [Spizellomyces punctatus DAOM BR117]|uniref:Uncharacterized protein n=1 Tax=Spizellomyces punctatus (strain DAOM BR117) TaxID=645134 RepID=A0A0L0HGL3_SPIPD|nr:uncharacterized protein SPPG_09136 [Spizellomyces punctatus DAOM BR117]KND00576.1 hypothetical protein SPPG_09136 [Spizellomyces punctatus DAOM BR117]|eukprot:XP_016608615.1 hypothetical protein SPPG_09136 [Spizellomyces punctatus DAOM BR117]